MPAFLRCDQCNKEGKLWVSFPRCSRISEPVKHAPAVIRQHTMFESVDAGFWTDGTLIICDSCKQLLDDEKVILRLVEC